MCGNPVMLMRNSISNEDEPDTRTQTITVTPVIKLTVSLAAVGLFLGWAFWTVWWARGMDVRVEAILESQKVTAATFSQLGSRIGALELQFQRLEATQTDIDRNGTAALKDLAAKVAANGMRIEAFSEKGTPGEHNRALDFEKRISTLERDIAVHLEMDKSKGKP